MGLFDRVRQLLGVGAEAAATRDADPEDLFGMSTAYVTMEAELGYAPAGTAALCFSDVDSTSFRDTVAEVREILDASAEEMGTVAEFHEDEYGYQWIVLQASDPEALVTSVHFAADTLIERGYGSRLLAALFTFERSDQKVYWVYSFRRGAYYPFAPQAGHERDSGTEFKLDSVLDGELGIEPDKEYWYPLWPSRSGAHPWE